MKARRWELILEFFVFGIILGVIEDALAVKMVSGEPLTWAALGMIVLITIPFAIIGELVVDNLNLTEKIKKVKEEEVVSKDSE